MYSLQTIQTKHTEYRASVQEGRKLSILWLARNTTGGSRSRAERSGEAQAVALWVAAAAWENHYAGKLAEVGFVRGLATLDVNLVVH